MNNYKSTDIAVIGLAGQFPGAKDVGKFWENIKNGVESVSFFSDDELLQAGVSKDFINSPFYVKANSCLKEKHYFDSAFFGYLPGEANLMDPQIRLFHQVCWHALEDAGYAEINMKNKTGLFAGGYVNNNWMNYVEISKSDDTDGFTTSSFSHITHLCSRVSYALNLQGPSVYVNTACSTSLVAVQKASMSLLLRECDMALAGGVRINNFSKKGYIYKEGVISSADGHCRPFDINASGTIGGEGVGVVVLKRVKDALEDNDHIYAIIKGSGINNDGSNKISYTAPSVEGQIAAITKALQMAKVEHESVGYIETHGTGTLLGDPIEVEALNNSYDKSEMPYCALGSVKANIGHLDTAAGIAGLIKTILILKNKQIPPSINFSEVNPKINLQDSPFYINTHLKNWRNNKYPLRAAVSSLGVGGTNVHIILEEALSQDNSSPGRPQQLLTISAKTQTSLKQNIANLKNYLESNQHVQLSDIAYTLNTCRASFKYRQALVCSENEEAIDILSSLNTTKDCCVKNKSSIVFMFPGQGAQFAKMCSKLFRTEQQFQDEIKTCVKIVKEQSGKDLEYVLFSDTQGKINNTEFTQPALFIIEYSLARLLMNWGIQPDIMIGHSIGEYVAACLAGVFTLEDALSLVVKRGELMQKMEKGEMLSIVIPEVELKPYLEKHTNVSLAAINSPSCCVISGTMVAVAQFAELMESEGYVSKKLQTSHAFHSYMMDDVLVEFEEAVKNVKANSPQIPFISNMTGKRATDYDVLNVKYWVDQLRDTVRFSDGIADILKNENVLFVEVGPGRSLSSFITANNFRKEGHAVINLLGNQREDDNSLSTVLAGIGKLWVNGVKPDWTRFYKNENRQKISFPGYSFDKIEYLVDVDARKMISELITDKSQLRMDMEEWFYSPTWKLSSESPPDFVADVSTYTLAFIDQYGVGQAIVDNYREKGEKIVCIGVGVTFEQLTPDLYTLNPGDEKSYQQLYEELIARNVLPGRIIHCWGISEEVDNWTEEPSFSQYKELCFYSLVNAFKAAQLHKSNLKEVIVLTSGLHNIFAKEHFSASAKALGLGLLKVIGQEYPNIVTGHVDISLTGEIDSRLLSILSKEIRYQQPGKVVSYRNLCRWVQMFEQIKIKNEFSHAGFRKEGVYLITGGLGEFGYALSKYLNKYFKAKLILLGKDTLPNREGWDDILNSGQSDENIKRKIERIKSIEYEGGKVLYFGCDISNTEQFSEIVNFSEKEYGTLDGVFHLAGLTNGKSVNVIDQLDRQDYEDQLTPKLNGLITLYDVLKNKALDFCVLSSSLASILGGLQFGGYASSNIFMDYFVHIHKSHSVLENWVSVNFDGINFSDEWNEHINQQELPDLINHIIQQKGLSQLVISTRQLQPRLDNWINKKYLSHNDAEESIEEVEFDDENGLTDVEKKLMKVWMNFFGRQDLGLDDDFFEIGGDSLKALTLISRINKELNVNILVSVFFQESSIRNLAAYIDTSLQIENIAIEKSVTKPYYQLSSAQQRLYFLYEFEKNSLAHNLPNIVELKGDVDMPKIEETFRQLIDRHESLRTCIIDVHGVAMQMILDKVIFSIEYSEIGEADVNAKVKEFIRPFDLANAPLLRVGLIKISELSHLLMLDMHHIITDGVSQGILIRDFVALYNSKELPELKLQYKDYAEWQQGHKQRTRLSDQLEFWKNEFSEEVSVLDLPTDFKRPQVNSFLASNRSFSLNKEDTRKLKAIGETVGATMFMTILAVFNVLLSKLSNQKDICIGTPISGRDHTDLEGITGIFINTLVFRNYPKGELSFLEFLQQVKTKAISCFENQSCQYEELIRELSVPRNANRNPLFDALFVFQNFELEEFSIPGLELQPYNSGGNRVTQFDLTLTAEESGGNLHLNFLYPTDLFEKHTIDRFVAYFEKIVAEITNNVDKKLSQIDVLLKQEYQLLNKFNDTTKELTPDETFIDVFERQVVNAPGKIAAIDHVEELSYYDLNCQANQLANTLLLAGLVCEMPVVVLTERSVSMLGSLIGIFKAGGVYTPLSTQLPMSRITEVFTDAQPKFLITTSSVLNEDLIKSLHSVAHGLQIICLDCIPGKDEFIKRNGQSQSEEGNVSLTQLNFSDRDDWSKSSTSKPPVIVTPGNLAYILYTSGSTGVPKGVMIEHCGMLNHLFAKRDDLKLNSGSIIAQNASETFDISIWQFLSALIVGGRTKIYSKELVLDPPEFLDRIDKDEITVLEVVPSYLSMLLTHVEVEPNKKRFLKLEYLLVTGETLHKPLVERWFKHFPNVKMVNAYGPTEASDDITHCILDSVPANGIIPIGKILPNLNIYIVDNNERLCPIGVKGEIYVSGVGVGRGYLNQPDKTEAVFTKDTFSLRNGLRMYKTGDIGRYLQDGNIEFFGRKDRQIKIRGHRVELGDIESHLISYPNVEQAVVIFSESANDKILAAFLTQKEDAALNLFDIKKFLKERLPDYMLPGLIRKVDKMPLTNSGKVDVKVLADSIDKQDKEKVSRIKPRTSIEQFLATTWTDLLSTDVINIDDNFFDVGGHSLILITANRKVIDEYLVELPLNLYYSSTLEQLAQEIEIRLKENINLGVFDSEDVDTITRE